MRSPRSAIVPLALLLLGPGLLGAQEEPLAAGTDGVPVPKKEKHVQPVYPQEALAEGIRGIVILDLVIDTEGQVVDTTVIRSIPGLDEAALAAVRQWRYAPVKVDGKPVSVRLTVPITFALKLPEMTRDSGIPELRQGVTPPWPASADGRGGSATADVTLDPDGRIGLANIIEGVEPWSTSLLRALRTWRFRPPREDASVSFRVEAQFVPGSGGEKGNVRLRLSGLRESQFFDAPADEPTPVATLEPQPGPEAPLSEAPTLEEAETPTPDEPERPTPEGPEAPASEGPEAPGDEPTTAPQVPAGPPAPEPTTESPPETPARVAEAKPEPSAPPAPGPTPDTTTPQPATPAAAPPAGPSLAGATSHPGPADAAPAAAARAAPDPTAPPPIEVITAAPPPLPPENGISAIRGVELEPGVPDLTRGRRPVSPPFARMAGVGGMVEVEFSVSGGGVTTVQRTTGPELLQPAATQAVESWIFRRTRADRAYLVAVFTYEDDLASAIVRPQPAP